MTDIPLWQSLQQEPLDNTEVTVLLQEMSTQPLAQRLPFLGWLGPCFSSESSALQVAAYRMLSGTTGYDSWKHMLQGLGSSDHHVQQAVLEALQASACEEPDRWYHLLFHKCPEIRQWATTHLPASFPAHGLFYLLPDLYTRKIVRHQLQDATLQPLHLPLLLDYVDHHQIGVVQALRWLSRMGWERHPEHHFAVLRHTRQIREWPTTPQQLEEIFTHPYLGEDDLDRWNELLWAGLDCGVPPVPEQSRSIWDALHDRWCRGYLSVDDLRRVVASIACVGFREWLWDPAPLALCARALPCILTHPKIPLDIRRAAVQRLQLSHQHLDLGKQFSALLYSDLCLQANVLLDLRTVGGLLKLLHGNPYKALLEHCHPDLIQASLLADPSAACDFLAHPPQGRKERSWHHQWLRSLVLPQNHPNPRIIVQLTLRLPVDRLSFLQWLHEWSLSALEEFCQCLLQATHPGQCPYSEHKFDRIAQQWVALMLPDHLPLLLQCLSLHQPMSFPHQQHQEITVSDINPLSLHTLAYLGRQVSVEVLVSTIMTLPWVALQNLLILEQHCPHFPYEQEQALLQAISQSTTPDLQRWLQTIQGDTPSLSSSESTESLHRRSQCGVSVKLSGDLKKNIETGSDTEMLAALASLFPQPVLGLCSSLQRRSLFFPQVACCLSLLTCADPLEQVASTLCRYMREEEDFLQQLDTRMVSLCQGFPDLPVVGNTWLYRWDRHHDLWIDQMLAQYPDLQQASLRLLMLESPVLSERGWRSLHRWMGRWRWHQRTRLQEICPESWCGILGDLLVAPLLRQVQKQDPIPVWANQTCLPGIQEEAAHILCILQELSWYPETMQALRLWLLPCLPQMLPSVQNILKSWLRSDGRHIKQKRLAASLEKVPAALLQKIRKNYIPRQLAEYCRDPRRGVVEEAASQLVTLGIEGIEVLLQAILEPPIPIHLRSLTATIGLWEEYPDALSALRGVLSRHDLSSEYRCLVAIGLYEAGESMWWPMIVDILHQDVEEDWFLAEDWLALQRMAQSSKELALTLLLSPQFAVYSRCLQILLVSDLVWDSRLEEALVSFLCQGSSRLHTYRLRVAQKLQHHHNWAGFPLLWTEALCVPHEKSDPDKRKAAEKLWQHTPTELVEKGVQSALYAGDRNVSLVRVLRCLTSPGVDTVARQSAFLRMLQTTHLANIQQGILEHLRPTSHRYNQLARLAETFAWGVQRGRELTGKMFRIEMIGGQEFGYTRFTERRIFVNPLPLLRAEQHGQDVLQGLILHEFGHHMYHADPESQKIWKEAQQSGFGSLLNLVSDEQLERNLRAKDRSYGHLLKRLAAYAFQHHDREMSFSSLLSILGMRAFSVLSQTPLRPSRREGHVLLSLGQLFLELEAKGSSFSRFVRALRMGLGDRHQDDKVQQALRLFHNKFRHSSMVDMFGMARKLRDIFGDEVSLLDVLSQDSLWGQVEHETVIAITEGISNDEIQREVERILRGSSTSSGPNTTAIRVINLRADETFPAIHNIVSMIHNPAEYRPYQQQVLRWSQQMREYFIRLGLGTVPQRRRMRGYRLDVPALPSALLYRDPRILQSRKMVFQTDLFVGILIDCSGSMAMNNNIERAKLFATLLAEAAAPLVGLDARFFGFTDTHIYDAGHAQRCAVHALQTSGGNNDAAALWHAAQIALQSRRRAKLLIMISDGSPTECSVQALRQLVQRIGRNFNISCAQIAVQPLDEICFPHYIEVMDQNLDLAIHQFGQIVARLVRQTLQR